MKVKELKEILNRFPDDYNIFCESGDRVISIGDMEDYSKTQPYSALIRTANVGFMYQGYLRDNIYNRNFYDYNAQRFVCTNCGVETKGDTYMRRNLLCERCCVWLNEKWEG